MSIYGQWECDANLIKYSNLEEYQSRIACWFETCGLTWDQTKWNN